MNYYPFHISDFRSGTFTMTRLARWIYRDMLDVYYDTEKPLTSNMGDLYEALGVSTEDERNTVDRVLRLKFVATDAGYTHDICDGVIAEYHKKAEVAKTNGQLGGRPKKSKAKPPAPDAAPPPPDLLSGCASPEASGSEMPQSTNPEKPTGFLSGSDPVISANPEKPSGLFSETDRVNLANPEITGSKANQEPRTKNQYTNHPPTQPTLIEDCARGANPVQLSIALRKHGVNCQPADPRLHALSVQGVTVEVADSACEEAKRSQPGKTVFPLGYVVAILTRWSAEASAMQVVGAGPPARASPAQYESNKDRARRTTLEGLTGYRSNERQPEIIDIDPMAE